MIARGYPAVTRDQAAPPRDPFVARRVRKPQQESSVSGQWRTMPNEIGPAQFIERSQKIVLVGKPGLVFRDDGRAVTVEPMRNGFPHLLPARYRRTPTAPTLRLLRTLEIAH